MWANDSALALPKGVYLICGDRAWQGVPRYAHGGPCYLGRLTLFAPGRSIIANLTRRTRRSISHLNFDCQDDVKLWGKTMRIFASLIPSIGVAHSLNTLNKLACWTVKQANITTDVLEQFSQDMDSLRHTILQNRAAIDFLLLAQGHGCEDIEGMCCFNLSNHATSVHSQLQWLKEHTKSITVTQFPFDSWLQKLGLGPWMRNILMMIAGPLLLLLAICISGPCIAQCLSQQARAIAHAVFEKGGGDVGVLSTGNAYGRV